jgi:hypothetical protein
MALEIQPSHPHSSRGKGSRKGKRIALPSLFKFTSKEPVLNSFITPLLSNCPELSCEAIGFLREVGL